MLNIWLLSVVIGVCACCEVALDCEDNEGRSLCYEKKCRRDVPCNKDNDCFFYGAADVSQGYPHPKCYLNKRAEIPPSYGICMLREFAGGLKRIPGGDVIDNKESGDIEENLNSLRSVFRDAFHKPNRK